MLGASESMKKALVISFEQLPACMLGCYGHQWIETPNFNRLAASSVLFDQHYANDLCSDQNSFPWWTGQSVPHVFETPSDCDISLISHLKKRGLKTNLLLESDRQTGRTAALRAQERYLTQFDQVETTTGLNGFKVDEAQTPVAQLMKTAIERLPDWMQNAEDQLIWISSEGVPAVPLAPEFFSTLYLDEVLDEGDIDENVADETEPPGELDEFTELSSSDDGTDDWQELMVAVSELFTSPEEWSELDDQERLMARAVYAGYITLIDHWFGRLLDQILKYAETQPVLLIVTAARGGNELLAPVRQVENGGLLEEISHVPLLIFDTENQQSGSRQQFLSQPADIPVTLSGWLKKPLEHVSCSGTNLCELLNSKQQISEKMIYAASDKAMAIRTSEFYYLQFRKDLQTTDSQSESTPNQQSKTQLYQKPVDRWDVYDLHQQLPEVDEQFSSHLEERRTNR